MSYNRNNSFFFNVLNRIGRPDESMYTTWRIEYIKDAVRLGEGKWRGRVAFVLLGGAGVMVV